MIDGETFLTGPVKNKTWKSIIEDKTMVNLPSIPVTRTGPEIPKVIGDVLIPPTPAKNIDVLILST